MKARFTVKGDVAKILDGESRHVGKTLKEAFKEGGEKLQQRGRSAISAGGFSGKLVSGFKVNVYPKGNSSGSPRIFGYHKIGYAGVFETGATIRGKPLLWVPIEQNLPGGQNWTPSKFVKQIGPLRGGRKGSRPLLFGQVSVNRSSKPVRLAKKGGLRGKSVGKVWLPVFAGVSVIKEPKRFDLTAEAEKTAAELNELFGQKWNSNG